MVRLAVHVEGQTEERFVEDVLAPHLEALGVFPQPVLIATGRNADGSRARGGGVNLDRVCLQLRRLLAGFPDGHVTTFYDLYAFGGRAPGESADALEARIHEALGAPANLVPYVQRHEFEALLLSAPDVVARHFRRDDLAGIIERALAPLGGPEDLNDGAATAPSKRLEAWTQGMPQRYASGTKLRHAPPICARIGLGPMRAACPRFDAWIARLERLAPA
ncbi:DUF4276 family protein [Salinarimonas chemoclinalis]|uniref:DUF4276 family protein n=1 Tax=Salinarimonas chemoclinalis TaxID=3241599 RepID=UPI0035568389